MALLCKLLGHKIHYNKLRDTPTAQRTGWEYPYNNFYKWVELGQRCERCHEQVPIAVISEPIEEKKNGN